MTLKKHTESTTGVSNQSWTTQWITFIAGWWKFSRKAMPTPSANIPTPVPRASTEFAVWKRLAAAAAVLSLLIAGSDALSDTKHRKKKSNKPKPVPCRIGCVTDTAALDLTSTSADDEAIQHELSSLARALHNATPGGYEKLADFSRKNASNVWGPRAALALGYDEYSKNHAPQAFAWLVKAKPDTLLSEYVIFWTAQTQRLLKHNGEALANLEIIQREHPSTAIKEQFLEVLGPAAIEA